MTLNSKSRLIIVALVLAVVFVVFCLRYWIPVGDNEDRMARDGDPIGSLEGESAAMRRALSTEGFEVIDPAGPSDWLAVHEEPGQSYDQFIAERFNRPDGVRRRIYVRQIGPFSDKQRRRVRRAMEFAAAYFQMEVGEQKAMILEPTSVTTRRNRFTGKRQVKTGDVIEILKGQLPSDAYCVLGVTMEDLYPGDEWNFVFGWAMFRGRVGVHSFVRYDPAFWGDDRGNDYEQLMLRRGCKVVVHEIGHMFGLGHCVYFKCLMNGFNHLAECDQRPMRLCPVCLRKLHHSIGFDVPERYEELAVFYEQAGFADEDSWVRRRLQWLVADRQ